MYQELLFNVNQVNPNTLELLNPFGQVFYNHIIEVSTSESIE